MIIQRDRLRESILRVDYANHLWHLDTNHKLVRWYFIIFGVTDGYSRLSVVLVCHNNNRSETLLGSYIQGVDKYGLPTRAKSDMGMENVLIADFMIEKRGTNRVKHDHW